MEEIYWDKERRYINYLPSVTKSIGTQYYGYTWNISALIGVQDLIRVKSSGMWRETNTIRCGRYHLGDKEKSNFGTITLVGECHRNQFCTQCYGYTSVSWCWS